MPCFSSLGAAATGVVKNYRVTVTAKNTAGATASATFNWQVTG